MGAGGIISFVVLIGLAVASGIDLHRVETNTLVIYTTPALQDFLDGWAIPTFQKQTGVHVVAVYGLSASEELARLKLSGLHPEADLFLQASPMFIEQGAAAGVLAPSNPGVDVGAANRSTTDPPTASHWSAFAWSPVVTVYSTKLTHNPDLANGTERLGLAHPLLSNNGVYVALLYDNVAPDARENALARTKAQPTNARATIGGVADGSFEAALGYEAVAQYYMDRGAKVKVGVPTFHGQGATTPVLFVASKVKDAPHRGADSFLRMLFTPAAQDAMAKYHLRPILPGHPLPKDALDLTGVRVVLQDWGQWKALSERLKAYEVKG